MIPEQKIEIGINYKNIEHFINKGYENIKCKMTIFVDVNDLPVNSHKKIKIKCDYCETPFDRVYRDHLKFAEKSPVKKDACNECRGLKTKESNLIIYGVESVAHVEDVINKKKRTNLERYGVESPLASQEIKDKIARGNLEKYGVENVFANKEIQEKIYETNFRKYGFKIATQSPEIKGKSVEKYVKTMYENKTAPTSRQQQYFHDILGGELNYPVGKLMLDIAFPKEKLYIEYQGSGHNLDVKLGKMTEEEFLKRERSRYYFLRNKGWKMIEIISNKDYIPLQDQIINMFKYAKKKLENNSHIEFNIDKSHVRIKDNIEKYDFGNLLSYAILRKHVINDTYEKLLS